MYKYSQIPNSIQWKIFRPIRHSIVSQRRYYLATSLPPGNNLHHGNVPKAADSFI